MLARGFFPHCFPSRDAHHEVFMKRRVMRYGLFLGLVSAWCLGCSGNTITKGTTPVTALAPSEPINYGGPNGNSRPPNPKDFLKGKIPSGPR